MTTASATAVQNAMLAARPGAVWFLQHWQDNPTAALLAGCAEPYFGLANNKTSAWASGAALYYNRGDVWKAARFLLDQLKANEALVNDAAWREFAIDVLRQVAIDGFSSGEARRKPEAFTCLDALLLRSQKWTLWKVWQQAQELSREVITAEDGTTSLGEMDTERALRHYRNYLCLMTIWKTTDTTNASKLSDYSHRNLGGLMEAYYGRRWKVYWAGQTQAQIRAEDATWWKTAPVPAEPVEATAADLLSLGEAILADALYTDTTGLAPVDWYDFTTAAAPDRGTFARSWNNGSFSLTTGKNGTLGAVTGSKWTNSNGTSLRDCTVSVEVSLGTTAESAFFCAGKNAADSQWAIRRSSTANQAEVVGVFTEAFPIPGASDTDFHRITVAIDNAGTTASIWLDSTPLSTDGYTVKSGGVGDFTAYQLGAVWGGGSNTGGFATAAFGGKFEDVRIYDQALTDEQVAALCAEPLEPFTWWSPDASDTENRWSVLRHWSRGKPTEGWAGIRTGTEPLTLTMDASPELSRLETAGDGALTLVGDAFSATQLAVGTDTDLAAGLATFAAGNVSIAAGNVSIAAGKTLTVNDNSTVPLGVGTINGSNGTLCVKNAQFSRTEVSATEPALEIAADATLTVNRDNGSSKSINKTVTVSGNGAVVLSKNNAANGWNVQSPQITLFSLRDEATLSFQAIEVLTHIIELQDSAQVEIVKAGGAIFKNGRIHVLGGAPKIVRPAGNATGSLSLQHLASAGGLTLAEGATLTLELPFTTVTNKSLALTGTGTLALAADTDLPALTGTGSLLVASGTATFNNGANSSYSGATTVAEGATLVLNCANSNGNGVLSANVADGAALTIDGTLEGRQGAFYRQVKGSGTLSVPAGGSLEVGCDGSTGIAGLATFRGTLEVGGTLGLPVWAAAHTYTLSGCNIVFEGSAGKITGTTSSYGNGSIEVTLSAGKSIFGAGTFASVGKNPMTVVLEAGSMLVTTGTAVAVEGTLTLPASGTVTVSAMDYGPVLKASGLTLEKFALPSEGAQGIFALVDAGATLAMVKKPTPSGQQPGDSTAYAEETLRQVADFIAAKGVYDDFSVVGKTGADRALTSSEIDSALSCFTDLLAYDEANNQVRVDYDFGVDFISLAKLSATTGSLAAGDYVVVCAKVDGNAGSATYADGTTVKLCLNDTELDAAPLSTETVNALTGDAPATGEAWFAVPTSTVLTQNGTFKFTVKAVK